MSRNFIILYYPSIAELLSFRLREQDQIYMIKNELELESRDHLLKRYREERKGKIILKRDLVIFDPGLYELTRMDLYTQEKKIDLLMKFISENRIENILMYQKNQVLKDKLIYMGKRIFMYDYFSEKFFNYQYYNLATYLRQENRAYNIFRELKEIEREIEKKIEEREKKRVTLLYLIYSKGKLYIPINHRVQRDMERLQSEEKRTMKGTHYFLQYATIEMIKEQNPDYIFYSVGKEEEREDIVEEFQKLNINLRRRIYEIPYGITSWDQNGLESKLLFIFMAKIVYGRELEEIDIKNKMKRFYERLYEIEIKEEELEKILNKKSNEDKINYDYILK